MMGCPTCGHAVIEMPLTVESETGPLCVGCSLDWWHEEERRYWSTQPRALRAPRKPEPDLGERLPEATRPKTHSRGTGAISFERGSGASVSVVRDLIVAIQENVLDFAHQAKRVKVVRDCLSPLVEAALDLLIASTPRHRRIDAAFLLRTSIEPLVKTAGLEAALKREAATRNRQLESWKNEARHNPETVRRDLIADGIETAPEATLKKHIYEGDVIRQTLAQAVGGFLKTTLKGPGHWRGLGQIDGAVIESVRNPKAKAELPCCWCGRTSGVPPFQCPICSKPTPTRLSIPCPYCGEVTVEPSSTCSNCNTTLPKDYRRPRPGRGTITVEMVARAETATKLEVEKRFEAEIEARRLEARLDALLEQVAAPPAERVAARAYLKSCWSVEDTVCAIDRQPPTVYALLARTRNRHPGLAELLSPKK